MRLLTHNMLASNVLVRAGGAVTCICSQLTHVGAERDERLPAADRGAATGDARGGVQRGCARLGTRARYALSCALTAPPPFRRAEFLKHILPKLEWAVLRDAAVRAPNSRRCTHMRRRL
jgi:hypothetical protein